MRNKFKLALEKLALSYDPFNVQYTPEQEAAHAARQQHIQQKMQESASSQAKQLGMRTGAFKQMVVGNVYAPPQSQPATPQRSVAPTIAMTQQMPAQSAPTLVGSPVGHTQMPTNPGSPRMTQAAPAQVKPSAVPLGYDPNQKGPIGRATGGTANNPQQPVATPQRAPAAANTAATAVQQPPVARPAANTAATAVQPVPSAGAATPTMQSPVAQPQSTAPPASSNRTARGTVMMQAAQPPSPAPAPTPVAKPMGRGGTMMMSAMAPPTMRSKFAEALSKIAGWLPHPFVLHSTPDQLEAFLVDMGSGKTPTLLPGMSASMTPEEMATIRGDAKRFHIQNKVRDIRASQPAVAQMSAPRTESTGRNLGAVDLAKANAETVQTQPSVPPPPQSMTASGIKPPARVFKPNLSVPASQAAPPARAPMMDPRLLAMRSPTSVKVGSDLSTNDKCVAGTQPTGNEHPNPLPDTQQNYSKTRLFSNSVEDAGDELIKKRLREMFSNADESKAHDEDVLKHYFPDIDSGKYVRRSRSLFEAVGHVMPKPLSVIRASRRHVMDDEHQAPLDAFLSKQQSHHSKGHELHKQWVSSGHKPEFFDPLLNHYKKVEDQLVAKYRKPNVPESAMREHYRSLAYQAAKGFDPNRGINLETVLHHHGKGLYRFSNQHNDMLRKVEENERLVGPVQQAIQFFQNERGREPTAHELATHLGKPVRQVMRAMKDATRREVAASAFEQDPMERVPSRFFEVEELVRMSNPPLLNEREMALMNHLTGHGFESPIQQTGAIAKSMGITDSAVSKLRKALQKKIDRFGSDE